MTEQFPAPNPETIQKDPIIEDLSVWRTNNGFENGHHGTYWNTDRSRYYYEKPCHIVGSEKQARKSVKLARHLTDQGLFHPSTMWRIGKKGNAYQIVATTTAINTWEPGRRGVEEVFAEGSHIMKLAKIIDPELNLPERPGENSLVWLLNLPELSHDDNWGTDPVTGHDYPIDVEALDLARPESMRIVNVWESGLKGP